MVPRAGMNDMEKNKFLALLGFELQPFDCPAVLYTDCTISALVWTQKREESRVEPLTVDMKL
jgi:hypothetical protein